MEIVFGIILLVAAVFLVVAVLMQHGKTKGLSGTISGGAETFFGKTKGQTVDKMLGKVTTIVAVIFVILVVIMYIIQPGTDKGNVDSDSLTPVVTDAADAETTAGDAETTAAEADTTAAE